MQAQAAEFSGYAGKFRCFLEGRVSFEAVGFRFIYFKTGSWLLPDFCGLATSHFPPPAPTEKDVYWEESSGQG